MCEIVSYEHECRQQNRRHTKDVYPHIDLDEKRRQLTCEEPLEGVEPTGLWWYAPYCSLVSVQAQYLKLS